MRNPKRTNAAKRCKVCKEAVISSRIYCERLQEYVDDLVYCPYFEPRHPVQLEALH
ncbi:MAG: hypothetical protein NWF03_03670 [Candidatus Bathyarchaeota archaeon]|nr:hypothetical protein [Candidatus Bathyarchaeota archaeon]